MNVRFRTVVTWLNQTVPSFRKASHDLGKAAVAGGVALLSATFIANALDARTVIVGIGGIVVGALMIAVGEP